MLVAKLHPAAEESGLAVLFGRARRRGLQLKTAGATVLWGVLIRWGKS